MNFSMHIVRNDKKQDLLGQLTDVFEVHFP